MGPIAELAAPLLAPVLQPIMQDVEKAVGGVIGEVGKGVGGMVDQVFNSLNPLQNLLGGFQNQGLCPASPFPFQQNGFLPGIFNNPLSILGNLFGQQGGGFGGVGGVGGGGGGGYGGGDISGGGMPSATPPGPSWSDLQSQMAAAEKSGDPAQMAAVQNKISQYTNFVQMISQMQKTQHDAEAAIIRNIA